MYCGVKKRVYADYHEYGNETEDWGIIDDIEKYFGLSNNLHIRVFRPKNTRLDFQLNLLYESPHIIQKNLWQIRELPTEINRIIYEFLFSRIELQCNVRCMEPYPFNHPIWSLVHCKESHSVIQFPKTYFLDMVNLHNSDNKISWSPIIRPEQDILRFLCRINFFDEEYI